MVDNNSNSVSNEKNQGGRQRSEQSPRNRSNYKYNQGRRQSNQNRQQRNTQAAGSGSTNREDSIQDQSAVQSNRHQPADKGNSNTSKVRERDSRDNTQSRGYYRNKNKDNSRGNDNPQRQHSSSGRYGGNNHRSRAEETIDDIKEDIVRIEKEIELEIKEIRSLKL